MAFGFALFWNALVGVPIVFFYIVPWRNKRLLRCGTGTAGRVVDKRVNKDADGDSTHEVDYTYEAGGQTLQGKAKLKSRGTSGKAKPIKARKAAKVPILLSGGNPQIAKADGDAPVQAFIAAMPSWKHEVGKRLRKLWLLRRVRRRYQQAVAQGFLNVGQSCLREAGVLLRT